MFPRSILVAAALSIFGVAATIAGGDPAAAIAPRSDEALVLTLAARGVQVYQCRAGADSGGRPAWTLVRPEAVLFNAGMRPVGQHGAGPVWRADDGSRVTGRVDAQAPAPVAGAIPWLRLAASADDSPGQFSGVTSILRVHTIGGVAPAGGCTSQTVGRFTRVAYRADYLFYAPQASVQAARSARPL